MQWQREFKEQTHLDNPFIPQTTFKEIKKQDSTIYVSDERQPRKVFSQEDKNKWLIAQDEYVIQKMSKEYSFQQVLDYCNRCHFSDEMRQYFLINYLPCEADGQCMLYCKFYNMGCTKRMFRRDI